MTTTLSSNAGRMGHAGHTSVNRLTKRGHCTAEPVTHAARVMGHPGHTPDFVAINRAALAVLPALLMRWLPDGRAQGHEFIARNPRRADRHAGSFKVNLRTGRWADFATGDRGGDPVSLAAYLFGLRQGEAAWRVADMLGLPGREARDAR